MKYLNRKRFPMAGPFGSRVFWPRHAVKKPRFFCLSPRRCFPHCALPKRAYDDKKPAYAVFLIIMPCSALFLKIYYISALSIIFSVSSRHISAVLFSPVLNSSAPPSTPSDTVLTDRQGTPHLAQVLSLIHI